MLQRNVGTCGYHQENGSIAQGSVGRLDANAALLCFQPTSIHILTTCTVIILENLYETMKPTKALEVTKLAKSPKAA